MWIRSQDKKRLVNSNLLEQINIYEINGKYCFSRDLGVYSTMERAMKVLDDMQDEIEINESIMPDQLMHKMSKLYKVFQMPQDDEVE